MSSSYGTPSTAAFSSPQRESLPLAIGLSVAAGVAGVAAWTLLAEAFSVRSAIVSFLVAFGSAGAFWRLAPRSKAAAPVILITTILSALAGLLGSQYALLAKAAGVGFWDAVKAVPVSKLPKLLTIGTTPITWLIMALSLFAGFRAVQRLRARATLLDRQLAGTGPLHATGVWATTAYPEQPQDGVAELTPADAPATQVPGAPAVAADPAAGAPGTPAS